MALLISCLLSALLLISTVKSSSSSSFELENGDGNRIVRPSPKHFRSFGLERGELSKRSRFEIPDYSPSPDILSENYFADDDADSYGDESYGLPVKEDLINDENLDPLSLHHALSSYYSLGGQVNFDQVIPQSQNYIIEIDPKSLTYPKPPRNLISGNTVTFLLHKDQFTLDSIGFIRNLNKLE